MTLWNAAGVQAPAVTRAVGEDGAPLPAALIARIVNVYADPFFRLVITVEVLVVVSPPQLQLGVTATGYWVIGEVPGSGASQVSETLWLPALATTLVGTPGFSGASAGPDAGDAGTLSPSALTAVTVME